ncbi:2-oxo acid dehydrogenase subunit E2 [Evansella sp. AB-rgal1]|uniref:2-oxo acid dehydrogenase subunit E2 n=1 Tax=Evansella sp. AB-rgal1 TaxID=3242696 RepID=UPI00359F0A69
MSKVKILPFPKERAHTFYFLKYARNYPTVHINTSIDMTAIINSRNKLLEEKGMKYSYITFLIEKIGTVIQRYPQAKSAVKGMILPKVAYYEETHAKITIDKNINGTRAVVSGLIQNVDQLSIHSIQEKVTYFRDSSFDDMEEFEPIRRLQSLPLMLGQIVYNKFINSFTKREHLLGTYSITSFGHRPIDFAYPVISSTLSFGVGRMKDTPVVIQDEVVIRPMLGVTLSFDHRALDGATASDILSDVKNELECYQL